MAIDIRSLQKRYIEFCSTQGTLPYKAILSAFFKAQVQKAQHEVTSFLIFLDDLKSIDFHPLFDVFVKIEASEIDAVDIIQRSSCSLDGDYVLLLLHTLDRKLRTVDLQDKSFGKDFLLGLSQRGLTCQVLNLRSSNFRKINMTGKFMQMHTMYLDFSASLTSFREDCFAFMPNLTCLSLCETRITNLWTSTTALFKLPSLVELRFQSCLCCRNTGPCPAIYSDNLATGLHNGASLLAADRRTEVYSDAEQDFVNTYSVTSFDVNRQSVSEDSSDDSELDFSHSWQEFDPMDGWNWLGGLQTEIFSWTWAMEEEEEPVLSSSNSSRMSCVALKKHFSYFPSPICFEKYYREYMIASLPNLKILNNLPIKKIDKDTAVAICSEHFEYLPYRRMNKQSVFSILQNREIKARHRCRGGTLSQKPSHDLGKSQSSYSRSFCAAKVGCSAWPFLRPLSISGGVQGGDYSGFRPRQFEYHPSNSCLMVIGTLDGEVFVVNHESMKIVAHIPSLGAMNSVLGLCWLKRYPSKLISGSDNGSLKLYDIQQMASGVTSSSFCPSSVTSDEFDQLTSVHVNATDELFLASGYSKDVALYDISSGNWQKPIQPCYTASSGRGNVVVCFLPDDHYLLASAVDNEVKQLLAVDGRLHLDFGIPSTGSSQNYTRSYYMNGRDYIISGSCDEHLVRICCAQTGRRLRDISLEGKGSGSSMFMQSLRGDPFRLHSQEFHVIFSLDMRHNPAITVLLVPGFPLSILAAYLSPNSNPEIVKVNMLASSELVKEYPPNQQCRPDYSMGG